MNSPLRIWAERTLFIFALAMIVVVYFYVTTPGLRDLVRPHQCLFLQATGLFCPACGGTRALGYLLDGRLQLALKYNALAVLSLPLVVYGTVTAFRLVFDRNYGPSDLKIAPFWIWSILALIIIFWIIRNLPYFSFLNPG